MNNFIHSKLKHIDESRGGRGLSAHFTFNVHIFLILLTFNYFLILQI